MSRKVKRTHELHKKLEALIEFCKVNEISLDFNGYELVMHSLVQYPDVPFTTFGIRPEDDYGSIQPNTPGSTINNGFDDELRLYFIE